MILTVGIALVLMMSTMVLGGDQCPPREDIYPCSCANVATGKRLFHTIVSCHRLYNAAALSRVFAALRGVSVDQLYLYDLFWEPKLLQKGKEEMLLPADWTAQLKIKEIEIVDSAMAECFTCRMEKYPKEKCRNTYTTRFSVINSTSSEKTCGICELGSNDGYPWTACLKRLSHLQISQGSITSIGPDLFPQEMTDLQFLNLTRNSISKIDAKAFVQLPRLKSLDLSHNRLSSLDKLFSSTMKALSFLDVSYNSIKIIGSGLFSRMPVIVFFYASDNLIVDLKESDWKSRPDTLRDIDLRENPINCECDMRWLNSTFKVSVVISGACSSPEEFEGTYLRKASRYLNERCDEEGILGTRKKSAATPPLPLLKNFALL